MRLKLPDVISLNTKGNIMNLYKAYIGAMKGLTDPYSQQQGHIRDIQKAIAGELALMRRRHVQGQIDGHIVSDNDMMRLKDKGERRLR
jgi:hypothetical protein